jgi:hypothetical protein
MCAPRRSATCTSAERLSVMENVAWRSWNTTRAVSNLHQRVQGSPRTACGLKIPVHGVEGEVLDDPSIVQRADWEGLLCERCFPDSADPDKPKVSRARWRERDRVRDLSVGAHQELWQADADQIWENLRGGVLVRLPDRWQLRRHSPGASPHIDVWELLDGRRPRLKPPTTWANRVLRTGRP